MVALAAEVCTSQQGRQALSNETVPSLHAIVPGWQWRTDDGGRLFRRFVFANYHATMAFVNVVAAIAHATDHHPEMAVHYGHCDVSFNTHDVAQPDGTVPSDLQAYLDQVVRPRLAPLQADAVASGALAEYIEKCRALAKEQAA